MAEEIHAAVWDRVGLENVQEFVRQWAEEYKHAEAEEDHEPPDLPLPPGHESLSIPEKWAGLAAVHDFWWKGDKINPWPPPPATDWDAGARWLREGLGWTYRQLLTRAARLTDEDEPFVARWLKDVTEGADGQGQAPPVLPEADAVTARLVNVLGKEQTRIIQVASDKNKSAEHRMMEIVAIDRTYLAKDSEEWAVLLEVNSSAIRKTVFWKKIQKLSDGAYGYAISQLHLA